MSVVGQLVYYYQDIIIMSNATMANVNVLSEIINIRISIITNISIFLRVVPLQS